MTALLEQRPPGIDVPFRPGDPLAVPFEWPAGFLAGRTWTATLGELALTVEVAGDVMTVTATPADTSATTAPSAFVLTDTTDADPRDRLIGTWSPSLRPSATSGPATPIELTTDVGVVVVDVAGAAIAGVAARTTALEADVVDLDGRTTALEVVTSVVHDWTTDGWSPFTVTRVNEDDGRFAQQAVSVVAARGRVTGHPGADGNSVRVAYERADTEWEDSEVLALWQGGSTFDGATATPQMGQFHRAKMQSGRWAAVVVTNNIFLTGPNVINQNVWNSDPLAADPELALFLGTNGGSKTVSDAALRRHLRVNAVERFTFGSVLNRYVVDPRHLYGLAATTPITIDVTDATFDHATAVLPQGLDDANGIVSTVDAEAGANVAYKLESGSIVPTEASARRYWPYWVRSQLVGTRLRVKVWRYLDPEPDWASTAHVVEQDFSRTTGLGGGVAGTPEPNARMPVGAGRCGLIGAHLRNGAYLEYGHFEARRL